MEDKEKAFLEAHAAYSDIIFRFCLFKLTNRELAKDVTQDTFMKAWIYISKGGEIQNMKALLYKTATNLVIDEYRKQDRRKGKQESLDVLHDEGFEPSFDDTQSLVDQIDGAEALALVASIPVPYGEAVFLRYVQDLSIAEIVELTGESDNTVSVRIHRGLAKLKEIYEQRHNNLHDKLQNLQRTA